MQACGPPSSGAEGPFWAAWKPAGVLAMLVGTVALYEMMQEHELKSAMLEGTPFPLRIFCYCTLVLIAVAIIAYDWDTLGSSIALKRAAIAVMVSWLLLVPLGTFSKAAIHSIWLVGVCGVGIAATIWVYWKFRGPYGTGGALGILIGSFVLAFQGQRFEAMEHVIGTILLFLAVYWSVRFLINVAMEKFLQPIQSWPGVEVVPKGSEEYKIKSEEFDLACATYADKYPFYLQVANLYRVKSGVAAANRGQLNRANNGNSRHLYHGTAKQSALGILENGFRLPAHHGMFGRGIYFADCPLKSWGYTDGSDTGIRNGIILMCWVELGRVKHEKAAQNHLVRPPHRSFRQWLRGEDRYSSVVGDDKDAGGSLRLPEFVIYDPQMCELDYIFEVKRVEPGTPPDEGALPP